MDSCIIHDTEALCFKVGNPAKTVEGKQYGRFLTIEFG
jgi:hypothetical protein